MEKTIPQIIKDLSLRLDSHYNSLEVCMTTDDENTMILSMLSILGNKESDQRLIRSFQLIGHPKLYDIQCIEKEFQKVRNLAIQVYSRHKHKLPKDQEVSGIFNVGMILANAIIQND